MSSLATINTLLGETEPESNDSCIISYPCTDSAVLGRLASKSNEGFSCRIPKDIIINADTDPTHIKKYLFSTNFPTPYQNPLRFDPSVSGEGRCVLLGQ